MGNATSSTAQDLARGKKTEIDSLNGYIVRRVGREHAGKSDAAWVDQTAGGIGRSLTPRPIGLYLWWCEWQQSPPQQAPPLQQSAFGEANEAPMVNAISAAIAMLVTNFFMTILLSIFFKSMPGRSAGNQIRRTRRRRKRPVESAMWLCRSAIKSGCAMAANEVRIGRSAGT
jgi:hypothetical protein